MWLLMIKPKSKVSSTTKAELGAANQLHSLASLLSKNTNYWMNISSQISLQKVFQDGQ